MLCSCFGLIVFFVNLMVTSIVFLGWSYDLNAADGMFSFFLVLEF